MDPEVLIAFEDELEKIAVWSTLKRGAQIVAKPVQAVTAGAKKGYKGAVEYAPAGAAGRKARLSGAYHGARETVAKPIRSIKSGAKSGYNAAAEYAPAGVAGRKVRLSGAYSGARKAVGLKPRNALGKAAPGKTTKALKPVQSPGRKNLQRTVGAGVAGVGIGAAGLAYSQKQPRGGYR